MVPPNVFLQRSRNNLNWSFHTDNYNRLFIRQPLAQNLGSHLFLNVCSVSQEDDNKVPMETFAPKKYLTCFFTSSFSITLLIHYQLFPNLYVSFSFFVRFFYLLPFIRRLFYFFCHRYSSLLFSFLLFIYCYIRVVHTIETAEVWRQQMTYQDKNNVLQLRTSRIRCLETIPQTRHYATTGLKRNACKRIGYKDRCLVVSWSPSKGEETC